MKYFWHPKLILIIIVILAAFLRFYNLNWDSNHHLHPDERFLVMVGNAMKPPPTIYDYLNPDTSTYNPTNVGYEFYVYGTFPLVLNKILGLELGNDSYNNFVIQGRALSAFFDMMTLLIVFKLLSLIRKHRNLPKDTVTLGTFFYAIAVLPIQLSHFFAVDTFLNFFMLTSFYFVLKYFYEHQWWTILVSGIFLGLALGSKVSGIYLLPLLFLLIVVTAWKKHSFTDHLPSSFFRIFPRNAFRGITLLLIFFLPMYFTLRLADPYYFADTNFFNAHANPLFLQNIKALESYSDPKGWFPPAVQWLHKTPVIFALYNVVFWGIGVVYFVFLGAGIAFLIKRHRHFELLALFTWVLLFFIYQSTQFAKTMRYFIILYPFFAILAGFGFHYLLEKYNKIVKSVFLILVLLYPLAFMSIYIRPMTRVAATDWITTHIPKGSVILNEHWDDALPLRSYEGGYIIHLMPVFDPDTPEKWEKMNAMLQVGDYLILSSNRGWGSMPTVPERYPMMKQFYADLFAGRHHYKKVIEFTSYPSFTYLGIPYSLPDDNAEESFTVYDHPKVMIFKNTAK